METVYLRKIENSGLSFPLYTALKSEEDGAITMEDLPNGMCYVLSRKGAFTVEKNTAYTQIKPTTCFAGNTSNLEAETDVAFPKIDRKSFDFIIKLFRSVYKKFASEVNVLLYYQESSNKWFIRLPKQDVSGASVKYSLTDDDVWYQDGKVVKTPANVVCFGTCHSHASMGAFFSGTDDGDDKSNIGYQIVIGKMNATEVEAKCRLTLPGQVLDRKLEEVIDDVDGMFPEIEVPEIVSKSYSTTPAAGTGYSYPGDYDYEGGYYSGYGTTQTTQSKKTSKKQEAKVSASEMDVTLLMTDGREISSTCPLTIVTVPKEEKKKGK